MVPYEAFLSEKPVLTTTDAGGPLEVVADGSTGLVVAPDAGELARAAGRLRRAPGRGARLRTGGPGIAARGHLGPGCIERLLA